MIKSLINGIQASMISEEDKVFKGKFCLILNGIMFAMNLVGGCIALSLSDPAGATVQLGIFTPAFASLFVIVKSAGVGPRLVLATLIVFALNTMILSTVSGGMWSPVLPYLPAMIIAAYLVAGAAGGFFLTVVLYAYFLTVSALELGLSLPIPNPACKRTYQRCTASSNFQYLSSSAFYLFSDTQV